MNIHSCNGHDVEQRVEATTSARQTATVEIQQAIDNALTAAAPPPSDTPLPATQVFVPVPTNTLAVTDTPTATVTIAATSLPPASFQSSSGDCKGETGNIKFINNTGLNANITLVLEKSGRTCRYAIFLIPGTSFFWIEPGRYDITINMCGDQTINFSNPLNSNWFFTLKQTFC
ncbi:MAG: hypothetical protein IIC79_05435 [Chloroflexi bacterium]|nr:hypothetical protein [Chloroflexota bacterium]